MIFFIWLELWIKDFKDNEVDLVSKCLLNISTVTKDALERNKLNNLG
jgi:hypothetical protein